MTDSPPQRCIVVSGNYRTNIFGAFHSRDGGREETRQRDFGGDKKTETADLIWFDRLAGFCASEDLAEEDPQGLCGNYGLYDCVKMLEWVCGRYLLFCSAT